MKVPLLILLPVVLFSFSACETPIPAADASQRNSAFAETPETGRTDASSPHAGTVDINNAAVEDLQQLPHVGPSMAKKIIDHREKYGPFKRPEDLLKIQGISDTRFRRIRHLIRVE